MTDQTPEDLAATALAKFTQAVGPTLLARTIKAADADRSPAHDPAAAQPCSTCPWLKTNIGAEHPDGFFDETEKARYWKSIATGQAFPCHKTRMDEAFVSPEAAAQGWRSTPENARSKECAGAVELMRREALLREQAGSEDAYFAVRGPHGVPERGFAVREARLRGTVGPAVRAIPNLEDRIEVDWIPWPLEGEEPALIVPPCDCPVCVRHGEAHAQAELTDPAGDVVTVDAALVPLIQRLWERDAVTGGSCQSMNEAIDRLWPDKRRIILAADSTAPEQMNYRVILRDDLAFVRGVKSRAWVDLADAVRETAARFEVAEWGPLIHVAFPLEMADDLAETL